MCGNETIPASTLYIRTKIHKKENIINRMEYIIENLTKREIDIMISSDIEWCPDDISSDNADIVVFTQKDLDRALYLMGRK